MPSAIIQAMILVTGGTGFIGQVLIRQLVERGFQVRTLIRPSLNSPNLPKGIPIEVAVCSLRDERGLRAALKDVTVVYHLVGVEGRGNRADLMAVDIQGTQAIASAASDAGVERIFYLSHLGADRASAYPVLKAKAIGESYIRQCQAAHTIIRTAIAFGPNDHFTMGLGFLLNALPFFFILPGRGESLVQPIWVEDLATCLVWALDNPATRDQTISIGGSEYLSFKTILDLIASKIGVKRMQIGMGPAYLRTLTVFLEHLFPAFPVSVFWLDYLAVDRTCALDTVPRMFGLMPARFSQRIDFLEGQKWRRDLWRILLRRRV
jgi:uncharacterized protein YbjT (DUF2867 family)